MGKCCQQDEERLETKAEQERRRRSYRRESAAANEIRLLKKIESLNSGRGTPKQKAQVVQELRQKYPLKPLLQLAWLPRKLELFYLEKFTSIDQLEKAIVEYINYYNNRRIKLKLNGLSPVQYRIQTVQVA